MNKEMKRGRLYQTMRNATVSAEHSKSLSKQGVIEEKDATQCQSWRMN